MSKFSAEKPPEITRSSGRRIWILWSVGILTVLLLAVPEVHSQLPSVLKSQDEAVRQSMLVISRQLGVTCNVCHNPSNFAASDKIQFKVAKDHIRLTQLLIDNGFDGQAGRPKADCFMCHRGNLKPDYKENFDPLTMQKAKAKEGKPASNPNEDSE